MLQNFKMSQHAQLNVTRLCYNNSEWHNMHKLHATRLCYNNSKCHNMHKRYVALLYCKNVTKSRPADKRYTKYIP